MTEAILKQAVEIKVKLDLARAIRKEIATFRSTCSGYFSEVTNKRFELYIYEDGENVRHSSISSAAAYAAFCVEFDAADVVVKGLEAELEALT